MGDKLYFDPYAMKKAVSEGAQILRRVQDKIDLLEESDDFRTNRKESADGMEGLREICRGYEKLLLYVNGAANVFGTAEASAAESVDF